MYVLILNSLMNEESEFENPPKNHRHFQVQFFLFNGLKVSKSNYLK